MDLDNILTLIFVCLPILFALICFYYAMFFLKAARNIEDSPTSKIRSAAQGHVELNGNPKPLTTEPTLGKLTQKPCAWYRYTIEIFQTINTGNQASSGWNLLDQGVSINPFLLDDGTGQCVILPEGAEIIPTQCTSWRGHKRIPDPPSTSFLKWLFWESWGAYRYTEYHLEFDVPIHASGMFCTLNATNPLTQSSQHLQTYLTKNNFSQFNVLLKEGLSPGDNFILSATSESHLIRLFKIKAFVFFVVFIFFSLITVRSSYPIIKQSLQEWQKYKSFIRIRN